MFINAYPGIPFIGAAGQPISIVCDTDPMTINFSILLTFCKKLIAGLLFFFILLSAFSVCEGAERIYFSIHIASFKSLKNTNRFLNSLKNKGKLVFWKQVDVPGKGLYHRVYLGKYTVHSEAVAFWKKLKAEGAVSYFGVHPFKETVESARRGNVEAPVSLPKKKAPSPEPAPAPAEQLPAIAVPKKPPEPVLVKVVPSPAETPTTPAPAAPSPKPPRNKKEAVPAPVSEKTASTSVSVVASPAHTVEKAVPNALVEVIDEIEPGQRVGRFVDNQDGTVTDTETGLMWVKNGWRLDFFSALTWWEARKKVAAFRAGGYSDWRMPTVEEWQTLIDPTHQYPALAEPNPFENIIAHMPYWSKTNFTYSSATTYAIESLQAYTVMLYAGTINHQNKSETAFVLPVRASQ